MTVPRVSYLICATAHSGGALLREVLRSTRVAGRPDTYFSREDEPLWARRWGVVDDADYVQATITQATTRNGLFGVEMWWDDLGRLHRRLRTLPGYGVLPAAALIAAVFPGLRHIFLTVREKLARAVSSVIDRQRESSAELEFDSTRISRCLREIEEGEVGWRRYFHAGRVQPLVVEFEAFVARPDETLSRISEFLGVDVGAGRGHPGLQRREQDDAVRAEWINRFRAGPSAAAGAERLSPR
jgi:LPS sulfotransferase NodH